MDAARARWGSSDCLDRELRRRTDAHQTALDDVVQRNKRLASLKGVLGLDSTQGGIWNLETVYLCDQELRPLIERYCSGPADAHHALHIIIAKRVSAATATVAHRVRKVVAALHGCHGLLKSCIVDRRFVSLPPGATTADSRLASRDAQILCRATPRLDDAVHRFVRSGDDVSLGWIEAFAVRLDRVLSRIWNRAIEIPMDVPWAVEPTLRFLQDAAAETVAAAAAAEAYYDCHEALIHHNAGRDPSSALWIEGPLLHTVLKQHSLPPISSNGVMDAVVDLHLTYMAEAIVSAFPADRKVPSRTNVHHLIRHALAADENLTRRQMVYQVMDRIY